MKKKVVSMLLAVAMCTSALGTTCFAAAGELDETNQSTTVTGDSTVANPKYKVTVPTTITFAVDPFEQKKQSQIYSQELPITNKSNIPVQITASVKVEAGAGKTVTIVDAESKVTETNTDKIVYIAAQIAGDLTETPKAAAAYTTPLVKDSAGSDVYDASLASALSGLTPPVTTAALADMVDVEKVEGDYTQSKAVTIGTTNTDMVFALAAAQYQEYFTDKDKKVSDSQFKAVAASKKGSAVFRFSGKVNTKAAWGDNDLKATVVYTMMGLTDTNYTAMTATPDPNAHAYVVQDEAPTFTASATPLTIDYTAGIGDSGVASIDSVIAMWDADEYDIYSANTTSGWAAATDDGSTITFDNVSGITAFASAPGAADGKLDVTVNYTDNAGNEQTATVKVLFTTGG